MRPTEMLLWAKVVGDRELNRSVCFSRSSLSAVFGGG